MTSMPWLRPSGHAGLWNSTMRLELVPRLLFLTPQMLAVSWFENGVLDLSVY